MRINNEAPNSLRVPLPARINMAQGSTPELPKVQILAYTGKSVDLSDYGFDAPMVYNIAGIKMSKSKIPYLAEHDHKRVLGHVETLSKAKHDVTAVAVHSFPSQESRDVAGGIENGVPYEASMGLEVDFSTIVRHSQGQVEVNGRVFDAPIYTAAESTVVELTATLFGRDGDTVITKLSKETLMKIKNASPTPTEEPTVPPADPTKEPTQPKADPDKTTTTPPQEEGEEGGEGTASVNNSKKPAAVHNGGIPAERILNGMRWNVEYPDHPKLVLNAVEQGWDKDRLDREVKLAQIENSYPQLPGAFRGDSKTKNSYLARLALSINIKPEFVEQKLGKEATDVAQKQGVMHLKEALMLCANSEGGRFNGHSDVSNMCKHIKQIKNHNAFSTIDFPNLMHTVSQWKLEEAWKMDAPFAPRFAMPLSNRDFRETQHIRPGGGEMWNGLNKEGKIDHGSYGTEDMYSTKLSTVAQILTFKREDIINDNIGWIETVLDLMIEGALMVPDYQLVNLIYNGVSAGVMSSSIPNKTVFDLPLTRDNLRTVYNAVKRRVVDKGDLQPTAKQNTKWTLVISDGLEETAWEIINQTKFVQGPNNEYIGEGNFWANKFNIEVFEQLDNVTYHADAKEGAWGLIPTSTRVAPYAITYLNNQRMPTMETVDLPADELGFGVRGYWDVNVGYRPVAGGMLQATAWSFPPNS